MRHSSRLLLAGFLLFAVAAADASAAGFLVPRDGSPPIAIQSHRVTVDLVDGMARTKVRQTFVNPGERPVEAIYLFPLPEGAALLDVAMEVDGKRLEGLLVERKRARAVYDEIVRGRRDPALVEQVGRNAFRLSVFPVVPGKPTVVELSYVEHVPLRHGAFRYVYPLANGGSAAATKEDFTITVNVRSSAPLVEVKGPAGMDVARKGTEEAVLSMEKSGAVLSEDVVVTARVETGEATLTVRSWRGTAGDGVFLAVITPPAVPEDRLVPRDVVLVLDTSGSMQGEKIGQAKASALYLLDHLRSADRVNIVRFSSAADAYAPAPVPADPEHLAELRAFVRGIEARGGTNLADGLRLAFAGEAAPGRVRTVVLLSDGLPTVGDTDPAILVKLAKEGGDRGLRIFPFGVGMDAGAGLLRGIAGAGRGTAELFRPGGEIESRLTAFLDRTSAPVLADVSLSADGATLADLFPRPVPDAYLGEQIVIAGRYRGGGETTFTASAVLGDRNVSLTAKAVLASEAGGEEAARLLHARMKLDWLGEQLRIRSGLSDEAWYAAIDRGQYSTADEIVDEMVAVSLESGVQCAYTSFLVLLPEDRERLNPRDFAALREALERLDEARGPRPESQATARGGPKPEERSVEDPVVRDAKVADHNETDADLPFEEGLGGDDFISDAPFEGPSTNGAIGVGGGAGGSFGGRGGRRTLRAEGGGTSTESAVDLGLEWLKNHQNREGNWDSDGFATQCRLNVCDGAGDAAFDPAVTGASLLAFLGAGETHKHGKYRDTVKEGLKYLKQVQDPEGCFGPRTSELHTLNHAVGTLAMAEGYALTASPLFKQSAQAGVDFVLKCRDPYLAWRYGVTPSENDTVLTGWTVMALASAKAAGLRTDPAAFDGAVSWLDRVTDPGSGRVGFTDPATAPGSEAMTAVGILARILAGQDPKSSEIIRKGTEVCLTKLPRWDEAAGTIDVGYWYFGTLSMFQVGGDAWKQWNEAIKTTIIDRQRKDGDERGSFDPKGAGAAVGGRVWSTALSAMCMEVYYRYGRVFGVR